MQERQKATEGDDFCKRGLRRKVEARTTNEKSAGVAQMLHGFGCIRGPIPFVED